MRFSFSLFVAALAAGVHASNVLELVPDNWDGIIGQGKPALVEFFAPWCGHCKNLAPVYEELADAFVHAKDKVVIAKVDADGEGKPLGQKYGVKGYPTLKWFDASGEPHDYEGGRDLDALANYITSNSGVRSKIKPPPPPSYQTLDSHNFDGVVLDKSKNALVAFTAPWCGHCKRMKPEFEKLGKDFQAENDCLIVNVDADAQGNKPLAEKYGITSFPTIKFFSKDNKEEPEDYEGGRTEADFVQYLNKKCGTQRSVGGSLNDLAGRLSELDTLASKFFVATGEARDAVYKEAKQLASDAGETSKHYIRYMEKVVGGTEAYLEKEANRLASLLKKRTLSPEKLDEIKIKANILAAFVEEKAEELEEALEDAARRATGHEEL
ncbi:hypothetical protein JAAARDRAFT_33964 [Jaapia argillacea MUCL 33604]|uniref:protein disulfide-isomerase n=1 Tax=Jaapia argillacea MUCL 33604 TaxID=933084 RepID=A0A067Q9H3_9AGAM|nr:hypothetical protein JAAARDRAFT_33964 [Jaapia argillacea MUCL 33604]